MSELIELTAVAAVELLKRGDIKAADLVRAAIARIEAVDTKINALPTRCFERALKHANSLSNKDIQNSVLGGLPIAIKDLNDVAGVRTTYGSTIYQNHVPSHSDLMVTRLESAGGIVIGKSNTPEFGAGASTFNEVFGKTHNPWNTNKSVAGSSGGAAAALASGQVWLAQGSDLGGSLRTPASFNSVIGLRPSPGRVPNGPRNQPFDTLSVSGPMARTAEDAALFLDALCGLDTGDPLSFSSPENSFLSTVRARRTPKRVAFSPNLGIVPVDKNIVAICEQAATRFEEMGANVEYARPDLSDAVNSFQVLRAALFASELAGELENHRDQLKPEVVWNIEKGLSLTATEVGQAQSMRARLFQNISEFFKHYDLLICPAAIVPPFDVNVRFIEQVEEHRFDNYIDWVSIAFALTLTGCPVVAAPAGFTQDALPVGLQIVGPHRSEAAVLTAAACLDDITGHSKVLPIYPRAG